MLVPPDYHTHTPLCRHATGEPVDYAARAVSLGISEMGFSDHNPMALDNFDDWRMRISDLDLYIEKVELARRKFPQLKIRIGLEVDFIPGYEQWVRELSARHPWDYFIGSVHYVSEDWAIDNPQRISEWKKRDPMEVWTAYFRRLSMAAESRLFQIIGHADLCKKFSFYPRQDCSSLFRTFLESAKRADVTIELNTAGLRKECREIYPSALILRLAREMGVPITFGSDAHAPEEVGMGFMQAVQAAKEAGYTHYCTFQQGQRGLEALP